MLTPNASEASSLPKDCCTIQYESPRTFNRLWVAGSRLSIEAATAMKLPPFHSPVALRHCGLSVHPYWSRAQVANEIAAFTVAIDVAKSFNAAAKPYRCELKLSTAVHLVDASIALPAAARQSHVSIPALQEDTPLAQTHQKYWRCDIPPIFTPDAVAQVIDHSVPAAFRRAEVFATFEHFSWVHSSHALACEVISSFGDRPITIMVHTNVRDHSAADNQGVERGRPFGQFNGGRKRIKELAQEHRCNAGCRFLKLPPFVVF
jgi:urease beta subunit